MIDPGLKDKHVLITGANNPQSIGAAIARQFAQAGAKVCLSYLRLSPQDFGLLEEEIEQAAETEEAGDAYYHYLRTQSAQAICDEIQANGGWASAVELDLSQPENCHQLFLWAAEELGPVDILINNAAHYAPYDTIFSARAESYRKTFDLNVGATYLLSAEYVKQYRKHKLKQGAIVNFSTDAAQTFAGQILYGASKAAIEALTRSTAIELGHLGIRVNTIAPGPVQTGYIPLAYAQSPGDIPLGRIGQPEDIAHTVLYLCSSQASWVTGQMIQVSGGHAPLR